MNMTARFIVTDAKKQGSGSFLKEKFYSTLKLRDVIPTYSRDIFASFNPDTSLASPYRSGIVVELKGGEK